MLVSLACVCVDRRKGCSFVVVPVPESTTAHSGQEPPVRLNVETRQCQCFLKTLWFEELATPTCDCTGRRKNLSGA